MGVSWSNIIVKSWGTSFVRYHWDSSIRNPWSVQSTYMLAVWRIHFLRYLPHPEKWGPTLWPELALRLEPPTAKHPYSRRHYESDGVRNDPIDPAKQHPAIMLHRLAVRTAWQLPQRGAVAQRALSTSSRRLVNDAKTAILENKAETTPEAKSEEDSTGLAENEARGLPQAPNRKDIWTRSQRARSKAMTGPRFEQTIFELQVSSVRPLACC